MGTKNLSYISGDRIETIKVDAETYRLEKQQVIWPLILGGLFAVFAVSLAWWVL